LLGSLLVLLAAVGMVRFDDVFARMHALSKANTAGIVLVLVGAAIHLTHPNDVTSLVLAAALQLLTSPVAANMISIATFDTEGAHLTVDMGEESEM
jgi:multicomponent Na+:H+ antiporter subunit G